MNQCSHGYSNNGGSRNTSTYVHKSSDLLYGYSIYTLYVCIQTKKFVLMRGFMKDGINRQYVPVCYILRLVPLRPEVECYIPH